MKIRSLILLLSIVFFSENIKAMSTSPPHYLLVESSVLSKGVVIDSPINLVRRDTFEVIAYFDKVKTAVTNEWQGSVDISFELYDLETKETILGGEKKLTFDSGYRGSSLFTFSSKELGDREDIGLSLEIVVLDEVVASNYSQITVSVKALKRTFFD